MKKDTTGCEAHNNPFERPLRWAELVMAEPDPETCDVGWWLDYFERTRCEGALISAGGIVAYYPTEVPLHHRSDWLNDRDIFGELVAGCRELGMVVTARVDPHAVRDEVREAHPDWIAANPDGSPMRHWSRPDMWAACTLGLYSFQHMTAVIEEIVERYEVDGIFANRWASPGLCHCGHCARSFRDTFGMELPQPDEPREGRRWRSYLQWRGDKILELWDRWEEAIRRIQPEARVVPNSGSISRLLNRRVLGQKAPLLHIDHQGRRGSTPIWAAGRMAKELIATRSDKPTVGLFSVGLEERYRWKDSVQTEAELRAWVADGIANGLRPMFVKFNATLQDRRWVPVVEQIYRRHALAGEYMRNVESLANVGLVYSQRQDRVAPPDMRKALGDHSNGMYHALVEARIPFDMVHDSTLDAKLADRYDVLVLPDVAFLSDEQCGQIRRYVKAGGNLVATFESSLYDEEGERREDFGLADIFGVRLIERPDGPMKNAYLRIDRSDCGTEAHPLVRGFEDAARIIHGAYRLEVEPVAEFPDRPVTLIPPYPDLPMEDVYPRVPETDIPEVYLREMGESRVAYFNWDADRIFWEVQCPDHGKLLANAVRWAARDRLPVTVSGPGIVEVTAWRQRSSITVHLVNLTNPMLMKGPCRELFPVGEQTVRIRLPEGTQPRSVHLLTAERECRCEPSAGALEVLVPSILDHEVVAVGL